MLRRRLGLLAEHGFRSLFASVTVSALGDAIALVALPFAILDHGSVTDLGIVLAGRQIASASALLAGGVLADRLPRNRILASAALVQGFAQAATAAVILAGSAPLALLLPLQIVWGLGDGCVQPATTGLIPQVVSDSRLQEANALVYTARSGMLTAGPAIGGLAVALGSSGAALVADAATFFVAASLLLGIRIGPLADAERRAGFLRELGEGLRAFRSMTWLWTSAIGFGIGNLVTQTLFVLGPEISKTHYGGASVWAATASAFSAGMILGGLVAIRIRPSRPFVASIAASTLVSTQQLAFGLRAPALVLIAVSVVAGAGLAIHISLWYTVFQREVPQALQSRVASVENVSAFVLNPIGTALAGPVGLAIGVSTTLVAGGVVAAVSNLVLLAIPVMWQIGRGRRDAGEPSVATVDA
jgi:MFS family permease